MSSDRKNDPLVGRKLHGTIEIVRRIGEGGMGYVYEGYQAHLDRKLAIKVMTPEHARNPVAAQYFIREAKSASRLRHPNIIQIIDFGKEDDATLFLAMEFVPGRPYTDLLASEHPLAPKRISEIFKQTLSGLAEAHAHGIVHRDLKPDNLMIERTRDGQDFVKILDFGIAHMRDSETKAGPLTQQGAVLGTPHYMSPEQARGERVDARSDLFAMGIILYETLTAKLPFDGRSMPEILIGIMNNEPPAPSTRCPELDIDPTLEAICLRALKKDPSLRYQSAADFRAAFDDVKARTPNAAPAAKFIFKRRAKKNSPSPEPARQPTPRPEVKPARDHQFETGETMLAGDTPAPQAPRHTNDADAHVLNVSDLFSTLDGDVQAPKIDGPPLQTPAPSATPTPQKPAAATRRTGFAGIGLDVQELKDDLIGDRRHVTAIVIHQRTNAAIDPEDLLELHEQIDLQIEAICQQWQGVLHSRQGGYTTLLFGFERPQSDDSFRAAQAALFMRQQFRTTTPAAVTFGFALASGEIFAAKGSLARAAGQPIDRATETCRVAADDEVLAAGEVFQDQLSSTFRLGPPSSTGEVAVLGMLDHEHLSGVDAISNKSEIVGRDREIAALLGALGRVARRKGGVMSISGEGGVGKSMLVRQTVALAEPRDFLVLKARWRQRGAAGVRDAISQWLGDLLRVLGRTRDQLLIALHEIGLAAEYARLLEGFLNNKMRDVINFQGGVRSLDQEANTERALEAAFRKLVLVLSDERSVLVVLDDVVDGQDDVWAGMFERWARSCETSRVLFLVGVRTYPGQPRPLVPADATLLNVDRFDERASFAFLKVNLPSNIPDTLRSKLVRLSAGNPLQLEQLALFVGRNPDASSEQLEEQLTAAPSVGDLMRQRLYSLPRNAQNILGLLSVLGDGADAQAIVDLASDAWQPEDTMQYLYDEGMMEVEETPLSAKLFFMPPALGQVVYRSMSKKARAKIHERAVAYLVEKGNARGSNTYDERFELARHLERLHRIEDALGVLDELATEAAAAFEYQSATEFLRRQKRLIDKLETPDRLKMFGIELDLVRLLYAQGAGKEALDRVIKLDRLQNLPEKLSREIRLELASIWLEEEDPIMLESMLKKLVQQLRRVTHSSDDELWVLIKATQLLARVYEKQKRFPQAEKVLFEGIELTETRGVMPHENPLGPSLIWAPLNQLGRLRLKGKDVAGAQKMFQLALNVVNEANDTLGEISVRANMSTMFIFQDRLDDAYRSLQTAIRLARKTSQMRLLAKLHHNRGLLHLRQYRVEVAREAFEQSELISREIDWREGVAMNISQLRSLDKSEERRNKPKSRF